jgi:hypothetical protein
MRRQFPDEDEVDQWLASHCLYEADAKASPVFDQLKAATADSVNQFRTAAPGMVSAGLGQWAAVNVADHDRTGIRTAARQVMAAESVGILSMCAHTQQVRPLLLICDPPIMVCTSCLPRQKTAIKALGHRWSHQCDRCGVQVQQLTPVIIGGLGYVTVSGHVCRRCADEDCRLAARHVDQVGMVGRTGSRRVGRRGGGRK